MIPRKKIQLLLCTICIFYAFGFGGGRTNASANATGPTTQISTQRRTELSTETPPVNGTESSTEFSTETATVNGTESSTELGAETPPVNGTESSAELGAETPPVNGTESSAETAGLNGTKSSTELSTETPPVNGTESSTEFSTETATVNGTESSTELGDETPPVNGTESSTEFSTETTTVNGTESSTELGAETPPVNGTESSTEFNTETATVNGTESSTEFSTETPIGNGTESTTEGRTDNHSELTNNTISQDNNTSLDSIETTTPGRQSYTTIDYVNRTEDVEEIISSYDSNTTSEETTTEFFTCKDTPSSVQNLMVSSTSTTLIVSWDSPTSNNECIFGYNIAWYSSYNYYSGYKNVSSSESNFTISGLTSCTYYTVGVSIVGVNGEAGNEETVTTNTTESQLSPVRNLVVYGLQYGLQVRWDPPEDQSCVGSYRIEVLTADNETLNTNTVLDTNTFYIFATLEACTNYTVQVTPVSVDGRDGTASVVSNQGTLASVPGGVTNLEAPTDQITEQSVYLTWSPPTVNQDCVQYYDVDVCYEDNCTRASTTDEFYNATHLKPCLNYKFAVSAVGDAGVSYSSIIIATTRPMTPGPPVSISVTPGQYSLYISWEMPRIGGTCVRSYRITLWDSGQTLITTETNITITELTACKSYTVQIIPVNTIGGDGQLGTISGMTEASVHYPPLLETDEQIMTKSTISIVWRIDRTSNECELKTVLTTCNFISTNGHGFKTYNGTSEDDISSLNTSNNDTINITVSNLSPFSKYECSARTENIAGYSQSSSVVTARTFEDVPSPPTMNISSIESTMFLLTWDEPEYLAGNLIEHEILLSWERKFLVPSFCENNNLSKITFNISGSTFDYFHSEAVAYSQYNASIRAKTNAGWGNYSDYISFQTAPDVPEAVTNINYLITPNSINANVLDTFLFWQLPCAVNGEIEQFYIHYTGIREGFKKHVSGPVVFNDVKNITADAVFTQNFGELYAEYYYTFEIYAQVLQVPETGPPSNYSIIYPAGIPPLPEESHMQLITVDPYVAERTSSTAWVILPLFENNNGEIMYYSIMISEYGLNDSTARRFDMSNGNWPNVNTWHEAMSHSPVTTYQATPIRWHPGETNDIQNYGHLDAVRFMLGGDVSCSKLPSKSYCNGPLRPDTMYAVCMRAFTSGGYRDSKPVFARTKAEFNLGMVIGVVFGILFLGIITTMMLLIRKGVLQTVLSNILHPSVPSSPGPDPLTRKRFEIHCQELIENPRKLSSEFQLLQTLSVDLDMAATAAGLQANRRKNRYINILPYDISRVKLDVINNDPNSDYINASLIPGYSGALEYIACQGPKEETTYDFWRMIYQYNVKVIVMVTQLVEKGKDKCHQYYPNTRENFEYEDIMVRCSTQLDFVFYTQRIITLQKGNIKKTIMHLHFKEWSDHGVPDDIHSMINFCQIVRKLMTDNKSLAVIHCSAGVGRTGTLIAIDILLQQIKDHKKLDIFGTVYRLRQHRMSMVQTESQYAYIYNCAKQALSNPYLPKQYMTSTVEPVYENLTKKQREITDSNTNLVNSVETLKKISPSLSTVSMEPISEILIPQRPVYTSQLSTLSLRYSKSTSAINTQLSPVLQLDRCGSHEYPIFEPAPESPSSGVSTDRNSFIEFARPIRYETRITRATSINDDDATDLSIYGIKPTY